MKVLSYKSWGKISQLILTLTRDNHHVLLVSDFDQTLMRMPTYEGCEKWFAQALQSNSLDEVKVDLYNIYQDTAMIRMDSQLPAYIDTWYTQSDMVKSMVLTSRDSRFQNVTFRELERGFGTNILNPPSIDKEMFLQTMQGNVTYTNGIYFTSGQNKGERLRDYVRHLSQDEPDYVIVFVDDSQHHVENVAKEFTKQEGYAIHYTAIDDVDFDEPGNEL